MDTTNEINDSMKRQKLNCKYTVKRILRKQPLDCFSNDDQGFLSDMGVRLKSSSHNSERLWRIAQQVGVKVVYRGDALKDTGYILAQVPDKASNTKISTPKKSTPNRGKYKTH